MFIGLAEHAQPVTDHPIRWSSRVKTTPDRGAWQFVLCSANIVGYSLAVALSGDAYTTNMALISKS
jgi:hypothetical protein